MYQQFNRYKILSEFFDQPNKKFQLRELSRRTKISLPSVKEHIKTLLKQGLIKEVKTDIYKGYKSSLNNEYKTLKRNDLILRLEKTGLLEELEKNFTPNCIVLYGSAVEGMDDERGDIDIFIQGKKKTFEIKKFEDLIKRKINLLFETDIRKIDNNLKNSLANGVVLRGFLKVI